MGSPSAVKNSSRTRWGWLAGALLLAIGLGPLAHADPVELYSERPDILRIQPKAHPELGAYWDSLKTGHLEATALLLEAYLKRDPRAVLYYLARDSELLYDLAKRMTRDEPTLHERIHLLNISRGNMKAAHVLDYLTQEGISEATLKAGKNIIFVDTGFSGTIPRVIGENFAPELRERMRTHLMSSSHSDHPSTRVFLTSMNPAAPGLDPSVLHGTLVAYEHMPRFTNRSDRFVLHKNRWEPASLKDSTTPHDGQIDRALARAYQEDLAHFADSTSTIERLRVRRAQWAKLVQLQSLDHEGLLQELKKLLANASNQDPYPEALVRDFVDWEQKSFKDPSEKISLFDLSLKDPGTARLSNKNQLVEKFPQWKVFLEDPESGIQALFQKKEFGTLGAIVDAIEDAEFLGIVASTLDQHSSLTPELRTLARAFAKKDHESFRGSLAYVLKREDFGPVEDIIEDWIQTGEEESLTAVTWHLLFKEDVTLRPEWIERLIAKGNGDLLKTLARALLDAENFARYPETGAWVERIILKTPDVHYTVVSQEYPWFWNERKDLLLHITQQADESVAKAVVRYHLWKPIGIDLPQVVRAIIEKQPVRVGRDAVSAFFSHPGSEREKELFGSFIQLKELQYHHSDFYSILARMVFSKPHSVAFREFFPLLIERGRNDTSVELAEKVFTQPHTAGWEMEMRLLIENSWPSTIYHTGALTILDKVTLKAPHWSDPRYDYLRQAVKIKDYKIRAKFLMTHGATLNCNRLLFPLAPLVH